MELNPFNSFNPFKGLNIRHGDRYSMATYYLDVRDINRLYDVRIRIMLPILLFSQSKDMLLDYGYEPAAV